MIDLWIIRHGETFENLNKICQGQNPGRLTEKGILQAKAVGEFLKNEAFDCFYSSDLKRTMESMGKIVQHHPDQTIIAEPLLRERYLAAWQGKPFPENWKKITPPVGAETVDDLINRASEYIAKIKQYHDGKRIAVMSHGGLIRALWTILSTSDNLGYYQWEPPLNTSISRFLLHEQEENETLFLNQVTHLKSTNDNLDSDNHTEWQL